MWLYSNHYFSALATSLDMFAIIGHIYKVFIPAIYTAHRPSDPVTGAQVEDKIPLGLEYLVTEPTRQLKQETRVLAQHLHR